MDERLINLYNKQAALYNKLRKKKRHIDHGWRQQLLSSVRGKILEVSVGAGANFRFYPSSSEVVAADVSPAMISMAERAAADHHMNATFVTAAVEDLQFEAESFDTIVSTLSLCAYNDPVHVLNLFNRWCKKDGSILMLEHGAGSYGVVRWVQNRMDKFQYRRIGCHANRDILQLVNQSNLAIEKAERRLLGIMYLIWARRGTGKR